MNRHLTTTDIKETVLAIATSNNAQACLPPRRRIIPEGYRWSPADIPSDDEGVIQRRIVRPGDASFSPRVPVIANIPLTPIEQNAPRRYERIAMIFPLDMAQWTQSQEQFGHLLQNCLNAFFVPLARWPFLAGTFFPSSRRPELTRLLYHRVFQPRAHFHLVKFRHPTKPPPRDRLKASIETYTALDNEGRVTWEEERVSLGDKFRFSTDDIDEDCFRWQVDPADEPSEDPPEFQPVSLCVSVENGLLILGFEFSKLIFDMDSIRNFIEVFLKGTCDSGWLKGEITGRNIPKAAPLAESNPEQFDCFDMNPGFYQMRTILPNLVTKIITIKASSLQAMKRNCEGEIEKLDEKSKFRTRPTIRDYLLALLWLQIMRARYQSGRFDRDMTARLNIAVSSASHTRKPYGSNPDYFGNSTVTAVAIAQAEEMSLEPDPESEDENALVVVGPLDYADAALEIRSAIDKVDGKFVRRLIGAKSRMTGVDDRHAYNKAYNPHTDSVSFEDWSDLASTGDAGLPYIRGAKGYFSPSPDHLEEGRIILLPRRSHDYSNEKWKLAVRIRDEDEDYLDAMLQREGFITE